MGFYPRLARSFGLVLLVAGSAAHASEVMRMPFACRSDGARAHLRPSEDRTYAVIGRREHEVFTTCSPLEPDRCSSWLVHRFEFDCDGERVAWIDAAAAATRFADWDAWIENGSFRMRMDRLWGVARARPHRERRRRMRERYFDADGGDGFGPPGGGYGNRVVTLPPGFAPTVGIPLSFEGGAPAVADGFEATPTPAPQAPAVAAYQAEPPMTPAGPLPPPDLPERAAVPQEGLAAAPPIVAPAPQPVTSPPQAASPEPSRQPAPEAAEALEAEATEVATAATPSQELKIINDPKAVATAPASTSKPATTSSQSELAASRIETSAVASPVDLRARPKEVGTPAEEATTSVAEATPPAPSETAARPTATLPQIDIETVAAGAAGTLALLSLALFGFVRWRGRSAPMVRRGDIGDISLGGGLKGLTYEHTPEAPDAGFGPSEPTPAAEEPPVPTSYAEALEVLGASPDSSTAAIKKIVDGLRQSWHPDLARSEPDRLQREARVRQINVAWDLVSQRRSAA